MKTITLKTLAEATPQEVFNHIANHLVRQGKKSIAHEIGCAYRGLNNTSCAAGCLATDEEYESRIKPYEGKIWHHLVENGAVPNSHYYLIRDLQRIHDRDDVWDSQEKLIVSLNRVASAYQLMPYSPKKQVQERTVYVVVSPEIREQTKELIYN